ncbi:MAG: hypothetical protein AB8I08_11650 [Sandaracinaceae bacterium]
MQAARRDQRQTDTVITIVGDDHAGALAEALRRQGPTVRQRAVTDDKDTFDGGPVLAVGIAAADGGATLRRRLGPDATIIVVLPEDAVGARLEAFRQGVAVVDATVTADTAQAVIDQLGAPSDATLGWVRTEDLMEAIAARLAARLGTGRGDRAQIKLEDGRALAKALDQFGDAVAAISAGTRVMDLKPISSPPPRDAVVSDLDWEDDPQTMKADHAKLEQYRRLAQSEGPKDASGIVATERAAQRDLSLELSPLPAEKGEPAPRTSLIRALRPVITQAEEPVVTLASNASSIELPALPGENSTEPSEPSGTAKAPLPAVLDPFAPARPPMLQESVPSVSSPLAERWKAETRFPLRLETPAPNRLSAWVWVMLLGVGGGALAAWWLFA